MTPSAALPLIALLVLVGAALAISLTENWWAGGRYAAWAAIAASVVAPALASIVVLSGQSAHLQGMLALDGRALPGMLLACATGGAAALLELGSARTTSAPRFALILYAASGGVVVAQSTHLLPALLGLATMGLALSALARAPATWTHFVLSGVGLATAGLGVALLYGGTGSLRTGLVVSIARDLSGEPAHALALAGLGLLLAGLGLWAGLVPFQTWIAGDFARLGTSESYLAGVLAPQAALALLSHLAGDWPVPLRQVMAWAGAISILYGYGRALAAGPGRGAIPGIVTAQAGFLALHTLLPDGTRSATLWISTANWVLTGACLWAGVAGVPRPSNEADVDRQSAEQPSSWLGASTAIGLLNMVGLLPLLGAGVQIQLFRGIVREGVGWALLPAAVGLLAAWVLVGHWIVGLWAGPRTDRQARPELTVVAGAAAGAVILGGLNAGALLHWLFGLAGTG